MGRLKAYEERICEDEEEKTEDQGHNKLMFANADFQSNQERYDSGRGRGGRYGNRGRG